MILLLNRRFLVSSVAQPASMSLTTVSDLHIILKSVSSAMLTSRAADGQMHSRAMTPCARRSLLRHGGCPLISHPSSIGLTIDSGFHRQ